MAVFFALEVANGNFCAIMELDYIAHSVTCLSVSNQGTLLRSSRMCLANRFTGTRLQLRDHQLDSKRKLLHHGVNDLVRLLADRQQVGQHNAKQQEVFFVNCLEGQSGQKVDSLCLQ